MTLFDTYGFNQWSINEFCTAVIILLGFICILLCVSLFYKKSINRNTNEIKELLSIIAENKEITHKNDQTEDKEEFDIITYM